MSRCLFIAAGAVLFAMPVVADQIITFDDLPAPTSIPQLVPNGYQGFQWTSMGYINETLAAAFPPPGPLNNGAVSPPNWALTLGATASATSSTTFTLVSMYLTSPDNTPGRTVQVMGLNGATVVGTQTVTLGTTPTRVTLNFSDITEIAFSNGAPTSIDDIDIVTSTPSGNITLAETPDLSANEESIAESIDNSGTFHNGTGSNASESLVVDTLSALPGSMLPVALDELAPTKFSNFASATAFNNESFEVQDMDSYLAGLRNGPGGTFLGSNGQLDASGLTVNSPNVDPGLQMIHSRMLAWNPASTMADTPGAVLGGIDMKDIKAAPSSAPQETPWHVFVRGNVILAQGFSQANLPHFDDNTESGVIGADYQFTRHFLAGVTAGYAHTDATLDTANSSATVDSYSPGVYAAYADGGWYTNFVGRYSYNSYTEQRNISFLGESANGVTDGNEGMADLDGGYEFHLGSWTLGPLAGLQYTHLTVNSYNESGSAADLSVAEDQSDSLRSRLGGSVRYNLGCGGVQFSPHLTASWQHEFMDQSRGITSAFTNFGGGSFSVQTENPSRDSALVDAGLDAAIDRSVTVFADYLVQAGQDNYFGQSVQAGVRIGF